MCEGSLSQGMWLKGYRKCRGSWREGGWKLGGGGRGKGVGRRGREKRRAEEWEEEWEGRGRKKKVTRMSWQACQEELP